MQHPQPDSGSEPQGDASSRNRFRNALAPDRDAWSNAAVKLPRPGYLAPAAAAILLAGCSGEVRSTARQDASPLTDEWHVLFIVADDLNDWVGCMGGHPGARTPNIDRLAERGVLFTQAHAAAPLSGPSRNALLTGRSPASTGVFTQSEASAADRDERYPILPESFEARGYRTFGAGKVQHDLKKPGRWDKYVSLPTTAVVPAAPMCGIDLDLEFDWGALDDPATEWRDSKHAAWIAGQMAAADAAKPGFFALGLAAPHTPMYIPREFHELHPLDSVQLPEVLADDRDDLPREALAIAAVHDDHRRIVEAGLWDDAVQAYLASVSFMDSSVGKALDALDASPLKDRTIVVFLSDNGWHLGEKGLWRKDTLWDESTHVPLIIAVPRMENAGARCDRVVSLLDVQATLMELCGLPRVEGDEGRSLVPLLENPAAEWDGAAVTWRSASERSVRTAEWCYIRYAEGEELYDRRADPQEWRNLAGDPAHAADLEAMRARLAEAARD